MSDNFLSHSNWGKVIKNMNCFALAIVAESPQRNNILVLYKSRYYFSYVHKKFYNLIFDYFVFLLSFVDDFVL